MGLTKPRLEKVVKLSKIIEDGKLSLVFTNLNWRLVAFIDGRCYYPTNEHSLMDIIGKISDNEDPNEDNESLSNDDATVGVDAHEILDTEED